MDPKILTSGISDDDWARLAKQAKTTPKQLQSQYESFVAEHPQHLREIAVKRGAAEKTQDCITRKFGISLFKVFGINGWVQFCGPSNNWTATFHIALELFGSDVWHTDYTLNPTNTSICYTVDITAVNAKFCVGIVGTNHCFNISGEGSYWAWTWHHKDFNETLFCFD